MHARSTRSTGRPARAAVSIALRAATVVVALALFARTLAACDLSRALALAMRVGPLLALTLLPSLLLFACEVWSWRALYAAVGARARFRTLFAARVVAEAISATIPAGAVVAEGVKTWIVARRERIDASVTAATLAGWKLGLAATHALFVAVTLPFAWRTLRAISPVLPTLGLIVAVALGLAAVAAHATLGSGGIASAVQRLLARAPIAALRRWAAHRRGSFESADRSAMLLARAPAAKKLRCLAPLVVHWLVEALDAWLLLALLGVRLGPGGAFAFDATVSWIRTVAFVAPAGLGVTDATTVEYFRALSIPDAATVAVTFVVLRRARDLVWIVVGYALLQWTSNSIEAIDV